MSHHNAPAFSPGRRVRSDLYAGKAGTIVKVRMPMGLDTQPSYDVAWDEDGGVEKVAQSLLQGPTWQILPETLNAAQTEARHRAFLETKLRARSKQAEARLAATSGGYKPPEVAFYRPSEAYIRSAAAAVRLPATLDDAKLAAKAMRTAFAAEFEGVRFTVQTKGDQVTVTWTDGPVFVTSITDKHTRGRTRHVADLQLPHAGRVMPRREISDSLIESAIEYVRQVIREPLVGLTAEMFRNGSLRDIYPRSDNARSGLSVGRLIRVVLLRWDDYALRFVPEGLTRAMVLENEALFPDKDMPAANARMRLIRETLNELQVDGGAFEEVANEFQRDT